MFKKFIHVIMFWFYMLIVLPVKRFYNYYIKGEYIENNMRTQALLQYLTKVINDPTYQPEGAYEQSFEDELLTAHNIVLERVRNGEFPDIPKDIEIDYSSARADYACEILFQMSDKYIIKED